MMREFIDFTLFVLSSLVEVIFSLDIGGYSFGDFCVVALIVSVFISSLVIKFRNSGSVSSVNRPIHRRGISGGHSGSQTGGDD